MATSSSGWTEDFTQASSLDSGLFPMRWGNGGEFSFGSNGLTIKSDGTAAGFMNKDQGASDSSGYGTYSATFSMPTSQASGAYVCLWPSTNSWPGPEIDLAEQNNGKGYLTVHWKGSAGQNSSQSVSFNADLSHSTTVSVDWQSSGLTFDVNGSQVAQFSAGGSVPVPKDAADGGENESFGVGNVGPAGTSLTLSSMSYTPSSDSSGSSSSGGSGSSGSGSTSPSPTSTPTASTAISVSSPGMHFISSAQSGVDAPITISDPGLKDVYAFVMNPQNVAESSWIDIPLDSKGQATHSFHFQNNGDYVLAVNDPTTQADRGVSAHIQILPTS